MEEYGPIESLDERVYRFKQYVASLNFDLKDTLRHPHIFEPKRTNFVPKLADVQYGDALLKEVLPLALGFQYAVTLHTRYRRLSSNVALELSADRTSHDFKFFANRLNYLIFKNAYKRDPENNRLLIVPCLDGMTFAANSGKTLHYHVGIGNVPETITIDLLEALVMKAWSKVQSARKNIDVRPCDPLWIFYSKKEAVMGNKMSIDWVNVSSPIRFPKL